MAAAASVGEAARAWASRSICPLSSDMAPACSPVK